MRVGLRGFSPAIDRLIDNRIYRPHTVDAVLQDTAIVVVQDDFERLSAPPVLSSYCFGEISRQRILLAALIQRLGLRGAWYERLGTIARFTADMERLFPSPEHSTAGGYCPTPDDFWWGGAEEQVIAKGSDWCHEVARVYCALAQVAAIPARIVYTLGQDDGHAIAECFVDGAWTLVDPLAAKVYRRDNGLQLGVVDMAGADLQQRRRYTIGRDGPYVHEQFFEFTAVAEYLLADAASYDYSLSPCNEFYRSLLSPTWNPS